jgi:hypothetical protein
MSIIIHDVILLVFIYISPIMKIYTLYDIPRLILDACHLSIGVAPFTAALVLQLKASCAHGREMYWKVTCLEA